MTEPTDTPGDLALSLLAIPLIVVSAGFSYYVIALDVPGGLASWSLTVLAYGLWLWPVGPLLRWGRWRQSRQPDLP
jgi:hypothetical protein